MSVFKMVMAARARVRIVTVAAVVAAMSFVVGCAAKKAGVVPTGSLREGPVAAEAYRVFPHIVSDTDGTPAINARSLLPERFTNMPIDTAVWRLSDIRTIRYDHQDLINPMRCFNGLGVETMHPFVRAFNAANPAGIAEDGTDRAAFFGEVADFVLHPTLPLAVILNKDGELGALRWGDARSRRMFNLPHSKIPGVNVGGHNVYSHPTFSPDGKWLAVRYHSSRDEKTPSKPYFIAMPVDPANPDFINENELYYLGRVPDLINVAWIDDPVSFVAFVDGGYHRWNFAGVRGSALRIFENDGDADAMIARSIAHRDDGLTIRDFLEILRIIERHQGYNAARHYAMNSINYLMINAKAMRFALGNDPNPANDPNIMPTRFMLLYGADDAILKERGILNLHPDRFAEVERDTPPREAAIEEIDAATDKAVSDEQQDGDDETVAVDTASSDEQQAGDDKTIAADTASSPEQQADGDDKTVATDTVSSPEQQITKENEKTDIAAPRATQFKKTPPREVSVTNLQKALNYIGYDLEVTGKFDMETYRAFLSYLRKFKAVHLDDIDENNLTSDSYGIFSWKYFRDNDNISHADIMREMSGRLGDRLIREKGADPRQYKYGVPFYYPWVPHQLNLSGGVRGETYKYEIYKELDDDSRGPLLASGYLDEDLSIKVLLPDVYIQHYIDGVRIEASCELSGDR